jgi:transcriptional regulator with XRE-family HTH domain
MRRTATVALPFCDVTLSAKRPLNSAYPERLVTLGDHIRKRRLDLGLFQKDAAAAIGVDTCTVTNWEKGRSEPGLRFIPRITAFLGYTAPSSSHTSIGERIRQYRYGHGISQKELARQIGIDPGTLSRVERGQEHCQMCVIKRVLAFFEESPNSSEDVVPTENRGAAPHV